MTSRCLVTKGKADDRSDLHGDERSSIKCSVGTHTMVVAEVYIPAAWIGWSHPDGDAVRLARRLRSQMTQTVGMNLFIGVVNLFNQQGSHQRRRQFTATTVSPIVSSQLTDLKH